MTQNRNITTKLKAILIMLGMFMALPGAVWSQSPSDTPADSLIINVGSSRIIFLVKDKKDLEELKQYDLNAILEKLSLKLEEQDSTNNLSSNGHKVSDTTIVVGSDIVNREIIDRDSEREVGYVRYRDEDNYNDRDRRYDDRSNRDRDWDRDDDRYRERERRSRRRRNYGTHHSFNLNLGTNNYLMDGEFPDDTNEIYSVRPWGSWYVELASINQSRIAGPLYLDWGFNLSWYNFKFQNDRVLLLEGEESVTFLEDVNPDLSFDKSKLSAVYLNASFVPVLGFGRGSDQRWKWRGKGSFRIGAGGYAGYRLFSYTKVKFDDGNDTEKDFEYDNFFLNNFRYGVRVQIGFSFTDLFFNYDLNELFQENRGPKLNAFSFGITL